jgi:hypothetical protein
MLLRTFLSSEMAQRGVFLSVFSGGSNKKRLKSLRAAEESTGKSVGSGPRP